MSGATADRRPIYTCGEWQIRRFSHGWAVERRVRTSEGASAPDEPDNGETTYHGTLAQACRRCALCIADAAEAQTLRQYARRLDEAILDLAPTVEEMQPRGREVRRDRVAAKSR